MAATASLPLKKRFRGYLPVVVDIETGGINPEKDAVLEVAAVILKMDPQGLLQPQQTWAEHIEAFPGANIDPEALAINHIIPDHPFRFALAEHVALQSLFSLVRTVLAETQCQRAVLVGHNAWFDLLFLNAWTKRCGFKRSPFHRFTSFDTATLAALALGQTVLAKSVQAAGIPFDPDEAHSAIYDAEKTAALFCEIINSYSFELPTKK